MELANEDSLRLNVLLKNVEAIRIDEQALTVHGLVPSATVPAPEARVALNPNCRPERYIKQVREFLSGAVLGSPGGYPLHLNRWTRMGQARDANLAELLLLGEPEAVTAVAHAPGLSDDLARRVWWIAPTSENARRMLERNAVVNGVMGKVLAAYLVDHLAFETEPSVMIESVRLVLQPGLIDAAKRRKLWDKGAQVYAYRVGFLQATPHELPDEHVPRADFPRIATMLDPLAADGNPCAKLLLQALAGPGQRFLATCQAVLRRPGHQDVAVALLNALGEYFADARIGAPNPRDIDEVVAAGRRAAEGGVSTALDDVLRVSSALSRECRAMAILSHVNEATATEILARTTAEGSLLRRKLEPVSGPILREVAALLGQPRDSAGPARAENA